jgi:hypothetical protein
LNGHLHKYELAPVHEYEVVLATNALKNRQNHDPTKGHPIPAAMLHKKFDFVRHYLATGYMFLH